MPALNGIAYTELFEEGSGQFAISRDSGFRGNRVFRVAWDDKWDFLKAVLGGVEVTGDGTRVVTPALRFEPTSYYRALDADVTPEFGRSVDADGYASYANAIVRAIYGIPDYNEEDDPDDPDTPLWIQGSAQARLMYLSVPGYEFTWDSDDAVAPEGIQMGIPVPYVDYSFTRYNMAGFEEERYEALMGRVNSDTFLGRTAGTLLFVGYAPERTVNVLGEYSGINLTISLSYRQVPWNYWYRGTSGPAAEPARWDILEANGSRLFPATAFGAVL